MSRSEVEGRYRKKPVTIQAVQLTGSSSQAYDVLQWIKGGDWIIRGEFYPCRPDIFAQTYEPDTGLKPGIHGTGQVSGPKVVPEASDTSGLGSKTGGPDTDTVEVDREEEVARAIYAERSLSRPWPVLTWYERQIYERMARAAIAALNGEDQG